MRLKAIFVPYEVLNVIARSKRDVAISRKGHLVAFGSDIVFDSDICPLGKVWIKKSPQLRRQPKYNFDEVKI